MHRTLVLFFVAFVYYAIVTFTLINFEAGILLTSLLLFGVPAYALARFSAAPSVVIALVVTFGAGIAILLEGIAHIYGIWYTLGVDELRLFGLIPVEVLVTSVVQTLFLALLYELIFDDGEYSTSSATSRFIAFGVFTLSVVLLIAIHQYLLHGIFFTHSYIWILGILCAASIATLAVTRSLTLRFFDRLSAFTLVACVPLLIGLCVAVLNTQKVFAYAHDYVYTFTFFGSMVPIEEVLLTLVMPLFVATFYELYLDDGKIVKTE